MSYVRCIRCKKKAVIEGTWCVLHYNNQYQIECIDRDAVRFAMAYLAANATEMEADGWFEDKTFTAEYVRHLAERLDGAGRDSRIIRYTTAETPYLGDPRLT